MRTVLFVFLVLVICSSSQCDKGETPEPYWGTVTATKDGSFWEARPYYGESRRHLNRIDIGFERFNQNGFLRETLVFGDVPYQVGKVYIPGAIDTIIRVGYVTSISGGDVQGDGYDLYTGGENFVTIDKINEDSSQIWGTFEATVIIDTAYFNDNAGLPDTIVFKNGEFHTRDFNK